MRAFSDFSRHVRALCLKEMRQILRDKSAILLGVVLPVILIILFGHGLSFDVKDIRLAVVNSEPSENATLYTQALSANRSFIVNVYPDRTRAMQALERFDVEAVVVFEKRPAAGEVQLLVNGIDSPRATMVFGDLQFAHDLLNGKTSSFTGMGTGQFQVYGFVEMLEQMAKLLSQVSIYLA